MWTSNEIKKLEELYPNMYNEDIANILGKTKKSIDMKSYRLGLVKSKKLLELRNKSGHKAKVDKGGRDLTYEFLHNVAKKYKTKIDFIINDNSAYQSARLKGFLNKICSHMTVVKFSIPQLICKKILDDLLNEKCKYNDRKAIKPYELDIFYENHMLAFEFQGIFWHKNNTNDLIKQKLCDKKNISLIKIFEVENSRNYETDIKKQIIELLPKINKVINGDLSKKDVLNIVVSDVYKNLYNKEELLLLAKNYSDYKNFKKNELSAYKKLCKLKLIDEATKHMVGKKLCKIKKTELELKSIISNFDNLTDFRREELRLYKHIKRTKKDYLISHLKRKKH